MNVTLKSGRVLTLGIAPFAIGALLWRTVASELKGVEIDIKASQIKNLAALQELDVGVLKNVVCQFLASEKLETVVFQCFERCTLDGRKITRETFESAEARADYLPSAWEVVRFNLSPFYAGIDLSSLTSGRATSSVLK